MTPSAQAASLTHGSAALRDRLALAAAGAAAVGGAAVFLASGAAGRGPIATGYGLVACLRLRDEVNVDRLRTALTATAGSAVHPAGVGVWLRSTSGSRR